MKLDSTDRVLLRLMIWACTIAFLIALFEIYVVW